MKVVGFDRRYLPEFVSLNTQWIEHYFKIEPMDVAQLETAEQTIIETGGEIFFAVGDDDRVVGVCAMVPHGSGYELAKMAVAPAARGRGVGDLLMKAAEAWARERQASAIMLLSNTILGASLKE